MNFVLNLRNYPLCLLFLLLIGSKPWACNSEEQQIINYLISLKMRYPYFAESATLNEAHLDYQVLKASLKELLERTFKEKGEISIFCGGPAKFFVILQHGEKITSPKDLRAYTSSPYLAHLSPIRQEASAFLSKTKTSNCAQWLAHTSSGWLGHSTDGLLILDSLGWKKRIVDGLRKDFEDDENIFFDACEREKIIHYNFFSAESWGLFEMYELKDRGVRILSECPDSGWPNKACLELSQAMFTGQI